MTDATRDDGPVRCGGSITATNEDFDHLLAGFSKLADHVYRETREPSASGQLVADARELAMLCFEIERAFRAVLLRGTYRRKLDLVIAMMRDPAWHALTLDEIAKHAGVSVATVKYASRCLKDEAGLPVRQWTRRAPRERAKPEE